MLDNVSSSSCFKSHQIVSLAHQNSCLYAEVIQEIPERHKCWVRPLFLAVDIYSVSPQVYSLRSASDLVWPIQAFSPAFDTEVIPFLTALESSQFESSENPQTVRSRFNHFIQQVWQKEQIASKEEQ
ncbi:hypothetical protein [Spirulina sp. 06S082]|uniref:hypothetical protein n=1 Tax=Spirulina sp. 06S082 TaxID=3110248 RepID=UPI002B1FFFCF|nr:hypothetical protein [Spirulina sp. 06S082]MEA5471739.1 hypothetical protein [Spirulina sp. 06S082]